MAREAGAIVVPPLIVLTLPPVGLADRGVGPKATLPTPIKIWQDAKDLIVDPGSCWAAGHRSRLARADLTPARGHRLRPRGRCRRGAGRAGRAKPVGDARPRPDLPGAPHGAAAGLAPISLAAFRDSAPSAIFVIFITAIWPVIINTAVGIRNIPQDYRNVARILRLNQAEYFWRIMVPAAAPYIFTGLRIGIGLSWLAIVAAEMLTGGVGIGFFIWDAWNSSRLSDIIVALVYIGVIGFVLDRLVALVGHFATRGVAAT
jgi:nitrate/nitrite transport system permease protein